MLYIAGLLEKMGNGLMKTYFKVKNNVRWGKNGVFVSLLRDKVPRNDYLGLPRSSRTKRASAHVVLVQDSLAMPKIGPNSTY